MRHLLQAFRSLARNKFEFWSNMAGLVVGLTFFSIILSHYAHEQSYDDFQPDNLYRIRVAHLTNGQLVPEARSYAGVGPALKKDFSEVTEFVRFSVQSLAIGTFATMERPEFLHQENRVFFASEQFFEVFNFKLIQGDPSNVLLAPNSAVITRSTALRYFGHTEVVGKEISRNGQTNFVITGLAEDIPENSHLKFDILLSFETLIEMRPDIKAEHAWSWWYFFTYVLTQEPVDLEIMDAKLKEEIDKYVPSPWNEQSFLYTQPVKDIHLHSNFVGEIEPNASASNLQYLMLMALLILVLSLLNFLNILVARTYFDMKKYAIRSVLGITRFQVFAGFLTRALLVIILALPLTAFCVYNIHLSGIIHFNFMEGFMIQKFWWLATMIMVGLISVLTIYPYLVVSRHWKGLTVLSKSVNSVSGGRFSMRNIFFSLQILLTYLALVATLVVSAQLALMLDYDLKADLNRVLVLQSPMEMEEEVRSQRGGAFMDELSNDPRFKAISWTSSVPGLEPWGAGGIRRLGESISESKQFQGLDVDENYFSLFNIPIKQGRGFRRNSSADRYTVVLNEMAREQLGFGSNEEALTEKIYMWGDTLSIVGIVEDYYHEGLGKEISPIVFRFREDYEVIAVKIGVNEYQGALEKLQTAWENHFEEYSFGYYVLEDKFDSLYQSEISLRKVFSILSVLALIVTVFGFVGILRIHLVRKVKEISIRRVIGSNLLDLCRLMMGHYFSPVLLSMLVGFPFGYYLLGLWLEGFSVRTSMDWWIFLTPCLLVLSLMNLIIFVLVRYAVSISPVKALRTE